MESIQLNVKGMKCGGCVSTVEKILNNSLLFHLIIPSAPLRVFEIQQLTDAKFFSNKYKKIKNC